MSSPSTPAPGMPRVVVALWALVMAGVAVYAVHVGAGVGTGARASELLDGWLYTGLVVAGAVGILARCALVAGERLAWGLIGTGAVCWAAGDVYWWRVLSGVEEPPYPSVADGLYLGFYPLVYAGVVLLVRARVRRFQASQWLDGLAAGLVVAAAGAAVVLPPIVAASEGDVAAVATNLAYPLGDLLLLSLIGALVALTGWRPGRAIGLLGLGCAVFSVADALYLHSVAIGSYVEGGPLDLFWPLGMVLMGIAAWQPSAAARRGRLEGWAVMVVPVVVCAGSLAILAVDRFRPTGGPLAFCLAAAAIGVCLVRAGLTFRENIALADSHRQAITDSLTGLPNRRLFLDRAEQTILRAGRQGERAAVMIIDLDRFKEVNDTLGHASGDVLLREIAHRLRRTLRESDTVARLGGDEFAVLLPGVADADAAALVAVALTAAISRPIAVEGLSLDTEASIGISLYPDHGVEVAVLLQRADVAMYTAKEDRLGHAFYGPERDNYSPERLAMLGELRHAIEDGQLVLHYQPKIDLANADFAGMEVLLRWQHPQRGLLPPAEFIPFAEQTTLIRPLTLHVIERALAQSRVWADEGRPMSVAVNISARNLLEPNFSDDVADRLMRFGVPAERLELEITETVLMANPARALEVLERLSTMGVVLSIDDFGSGYSSLSYLKRLPVDVLKIDKSFVLNMSTSPADAMIVRSTIDLARNLGLRVVAEGIEDQAVYDALRELGCDLGQGFLMSHPLAAEDIGRLLASRAGVSAPA